MEGGIFGLIVFIVIVVFFVTVGQRHEENTCRAYAEATGVNTTMIDNSCFAKDGDQWVYLWKYKEKYGYPVKH